MFSNQMLLARFPVVAKILSLGVQYPFINHSIFVPYKLSLLMVEWLDLGKCGSPNRIN